MERDFLGLRKDSGQFVNEELRAGGKDGAFLGSAMLWPLSTKTTEMQQYMSYKTTQEEKQKKFTIEQFPTSGFQSMSAMDGFEPQKTSVPMSMQKFDRQVINQFPVQTYQPQGTETLINSPHQLNGNRTFPVISHNLFPVATAAPFFQVHGAQISPNVTVTSLNQLPYGINTSGSGSGSAYGTFPPRKMPKHSSNTAQLTIFYAGTVNVFDDVPVEKAQAIMLMASKGSNVDSDIAKPRSEVPLKSSVPVPTILTPISSPTLRTKVSTPMFQTTVQGSILQSAVPVMTNGLNSKVPMAAPIRVPSPHSPVSSPISVTSRLGANSGTVSSTTDDLAGPKMAGPLTSASPQVNSKSSTDVSGSTTPLDIMPRAVPQARKASLARFLEKRKERITNVMPYSYDKKNIDSGAQLDATNATKLSSSRDAKISSKRVDSWCSGQSKASLICAESPSTELEM